MATDIMQARASIESQINGIQGINGTGMNFGNKSIILYVKDYSVETEVRNRVGDHPYGFNLQFIYTGKIVSY